MKTKIILAFLILSFYNILFAQWTKLPLPSVQNKEKVYPSLISINDSILFVSGKNIGLFRSTDYGESWVISKSIFTEGSGVHTLFAFDSVLIAYGYNNLSNSIIAISKNGGENWQIIDNPDLIYCDKIIQTYSGNNKKYIALYFDLSRGYLSDDSGVTWKQINSNIYSLLTTSISVSFITSIGQSIYAAGSCNNSSFIVASNDNGITWAAKNNGLPNNINDFNPMGIIASGSNLIVGSYQGAFLSSDFGKNWLEIKLNNDYDTYRVNYLKTDGEIVYINVSNNNLYASFKSFDNGKSWTPIDEYPYGPIGKKLFCKLNDDYSISISKDKGITWIKKETFFYKISNNPINAFTINGDNLFLAANNFKYKSNLKEISWQTFTIDRNTVASLLTPGSHKFKLSWDSYATTDNGYTWNNLTIPMTSSIGVHGANGPTVYDFDECSSQVILARSDGIYKYEGGVISGKLMHDIPAQSIATSFPYMFISAKDGIYRSKDCGQTIEKVLQLDYYIRLTAYNSTVIGCYKPNGEIWISFDNGNTWGKKFVGITDIIDLSVNEEYIFIATKYDIWKIPLNGLLTDAKEKDESLPVLFTLSQNYPNPFNPTTNIQYSIPQAGHVTLKVYDVLGNEVATLVNEYKQPGNYNSMFSALRTSLSSGVYFYRLQSGSFTTTKKFVLMK